MMVHGSHQPLLKHSFFFACFHSLDFLILFMLLCTLALIRDTCIPLKNIPPGVVLIWFG